MPFRAALFGVCLCVAGLSINQNRSLDVRAAKMSGANLRKYAIEAPLPPYPVASVKAGTQGVAVVGLAVDQSGQVRSVNVLQAPDGDIARAVRSTLKGWTFSLPMRPDGHPSRFTSRLAFYFAIRDGAGLVLAPDLAAKSGHFRLRTNAR